MKTTNNVLNGLLLQHYIMKRLSHIPNSENTLINYDWSELKFPVAIKEINKFEINNDISLTY